jgi:hypothetical protein
MQQHALSILSSAWAQQLSRNVPTYAGFLLHKAHVFRDKIKGTHCNKYDSALVLPSKSESVPVHAKKAYRGSRRNAPFIPNLGAGRRWADNIKLRLLHPQERTVVPILYEVWVGPGACLCVLENRKSRAPAAVSAPDRPAHSPVAMPTMPRRLLVQESLYNGFHLSASHRKTLRGPVKCCS